MASDVLSTEALEWIISEPAFRGLWRSKWIGEAGEVEEGWAVTYVFGDDYLEMPYQATALGAVNEAKRRLQEHRNKGKPL